MKIILGPTLLLVAASSLYAPLASADPLHKALAECRQQQNALKRLVCYDEISVTTITTKTVTPVAITKPTNQATQAEPPATSADSTVVTTAETTPTNFGLEHKKTAEQADVLYLNVSSISYSPRKELIVEFDNGQIWRQNGSGYYKIAIGERHYVKRGILNSFTLGNDNNNRTIKVRRVR